MLALSVGSDSKTSGVGDGDGVWADSDAETARAAQARRVVVAGFMEQESLSDNPAGCKCAGSRTQGRDHAFTHRKPRQWVPGINLALPRLPTI